MEKHTYIFSESTIYVMVKHYPVISNVVSCINTHNYVFNTTVKQSICIIYILYNIYIQLYYNNMQGLLVLDLQLIVTTGNNDRDCSFFCIMQFYNKRIMSRGNRRPCLSVKCIRGASWRRQMAPINVVTNIIIKIPPFYTNV